MTVQSLTSEQLNKIHEECGGSLEATADRLGVSYADFAINIGPKLSPAPMSQAPRRRQPPPLLGQDWCRKHTIAVRHCENPNWGKADEAKILDARVKYEAGTHEMLTGRDGDFFILYCVPRRVRCGVRKFFQVD